MIRDGEQGTQQQINTNIKAFRKHLMANIQNKCTLWPRRFSHLPKQSAASKIVLQKVSHDINGLFKQETKKNQNSCDIYIFITDSPN